MYLHCSHMFLTSQVDDYTEVGLFDHTLVPSLCMTTCVFNHAKRIVHLCEWVRHHVKRTHVYIVVSAVLFLFHYPVLLLVQRMMM